MTASAIAAELAPTGVLRAAINLANIVLARKDPTSGRLGGVSVKLAEEIAARLSIPLELVEFEAASKVSASAGGGVWDIAFLAADPARAETIDFTVPYTSLEGAYLVEARSPYLSVDDLDHSEARITAARNSAYALYLGRTLKHAALIEAETSEAGVALFKSLGADAAAGVRQPLDRYAKADPALRVLPDAFTRIEQSVAVPKGRPGAIAYLNSLMPALAASGFFDRHL